MKLKLKLAVIFKIELKKSLVLWYVVFIQPREYISNWIFLCCYVVLLSSTKSLSRRWLCWVPDQPGLQEVGNIFDSQQTEARLKQRSVCLSVCDSFSASACLSVCSLVTMPGDCSGNGNGNGNVGKCRPVQRRACNELEAMKAKLLPKFGRQVPLISQQLSSSPPPPESRLKCNTKKATKADTTTKLNATIKSRAAATLKPLVVRLFGDKFTNS